MGLLLIGDCAWPPDAARMPLRNSRLEFQAKPSQGVGDCKSNYKDPYPIFDQNRRKWRESYSGFVLLRRLSRPRLLALIRNQIGPPVFLYL